MRYKGTPDFNHAETGCIGILLTNLGTPEAPTAAAVRRYLGEFLADPRIVEAPRWLWWLVLHGIILRFRPRRAAHAYASIWSEQGSPLLVNTRNQATALQTRLDRQFRLPVKVAVGMRYGKPSLAEGLAELRQAGARRILVLPLYPQYSATTTASTFDALAAELRTWRWLPELRMVAHYHDHPGYIRSVAQSIERFWQQHGRPQKLLFSFHGLPRRYLLAGDPYHCECHKTARLVATQLGLDQQDWQLCFQSRFGREEWLKPYADETLKTLPSQGIKHVHIISPGFASDCLETLEELNMQNRALFMQAGGEAYEYIPALNAEAAHIDFLAELVTEHAGAWCEASLEDGAFIQQRARSLGAVD